jgi:hypothetical protein
MPNHRQFSLSTQVSNCRLRVHGIGVICHRAPESQEVEDQRIDDLEWERVLLLEKGLDENVTRPGSIGIAGHLLRGDFA